MKKVLSMVLAGAMVLSLAACGSSSSGSATTAAETTKATAETTAAGTTAAGAATTAAGAETTAAAATATEGGKKVGISMPTKSLERWNRDGSYLEEQFKGKGCEVELTYSDNKIDQQVKDIENLIADKVNLLVVAAIDGESLSNVLDSAKEAGIPVISYDRLIMNTDAISYYATFDNYKVGQKQGEYLVDALDLDNQDGPFNIELFTGDPGDNNCNFFFGGAMDVLQKYIDEGKLVVKSGQTEFEQVATANWDSAKAQDRMDTIIAGNYSDGTNLDAVLCSNDSTALGVENALAASYTGEYPIITGQDCDTPNVKNLVAGKQAMSVFKDTRALASAVVNMVDAIMKGEEPEINDTESYDNGTGVIPTYLCDPVVVTVDNYKEMLIDSGYYTEDQIK